MVRIKGTVTRYDRRRGFGFIKPESGEGKSVFVHWQEISSSDKWPALDKGMTVEYELQDDGDGAKKRAMDVTAENGAEIHVDEEYDEPNLSKFTTHGTVKFFSRRGFGFITTDNEIKWPEKLAEGADVYVTREHIVVDDGAACGLTKGMRVQFKAYKIEGQEGLRAGDVRAEGGGPVVFTPREFDPEKKQAKRVRKFKVKKTAMKSASKGKSKGGKQQRGGSKDDAWEAAYQKGLAKGVAKAAGKGGKNEATQGVKKTIQKTQTPQTNKVNTGGRKANGVGPGGSQSKAPWAKGKGGDNRDNKGKGKGLIRVKSEVL